MILPLTVFLLWFGPAPAMLGGQSDDSLRSECPSFPALAATTHREVQALLDDVVARSFPELSRSQVLLYQLRSRSDFFVSGIEYRTILKRGPVRTYIIYANPRLFVSPPSREAVRAVLAHELSHLVDYSRLSAPGVVKFVAHYLSSTASEYERSTDLHALERGYACGLAEYREWLYQHVSPPVEARKEITYMTPLEIRAWYREHLADDLARHPVRREN